MSNYVTNVYIENYITAQEASANGGRKGTTTGYMQCIEYDANGTYRYPAELIEGKTLKFTLDDWNGTDANIDYIKIKFNGFTVCTINEEWWVNGDKSVTIPSTSLVGFNTSSWAHKYITAYFHFEDGKGSEEYSILEVYALLPSLQSIYIDTMPNQTSFYLNESFNYNGLVVKANYKYQVSGDTFNSTVSNPDVYSPSMITSGTKSVNVRYGGANTSYNIIVHGVERYTFGSPYVSHFRKDIDDENAIFPITLTINYSNGVTDTVTLTSSNTNVSVSKSNSTWTITVSATASRTSETLSTSYSITIENPNSLSVTTQPTKKVYTPGESIDTSGMVVKANYANCNSYTLSSDHYNISNFDTSSAGTKTYTITYSSVNTTVTYYVNGMTEASVDLSLVNTPGTEKYYRTTYLYGYLDDVLNDLTTILGRIRMSYTTRTYQSDGTYTDSTAIAPRNEISVTQNTPVKGDNTYTVSISKNAIILTDTFLLKTYKYEALEVVGTRSIVYYGVNNTIQITPELKVYGVDTDDNSKIELVYDETYSINPSVGSTYPLGESTVRFTSLENNVYTDVTVNCIEDSPASGATISTSGSLDKTAINDTYYYSVGDTINLSSLQLVISEMESGLINYTVTSDNYSKRLYRTSGQQEIEKNSLTFNSDDATGDYTLELSFGELSVTYSLVLDYVSSVSVDNQTTKLVYKAGESLDLSTIKGTATMASGDTRDIVLSDITSIEHTFVKSDTSDNDSETETLSITICGIAKSIEFTIICVKAATINLAKTAYNIHDELVINAIAVLYSDETTVKVLSAEEKATITWVDGVNSFDITNMTFTNIRNTNEFTLTGTYIEAGVSVTITKNITIKALKQINLVDRSMNSKSIVVLEYNTMISSLSNDYFLYPVFNDNSTLSGIETIGSIYSLNDSTITSTKLKTRTQVYTPYNWVVDNEIIDTLNCNFTLYCMQLVGLSLDWDDIDAQHYVGDVLNMESVTDIVASYSALIDGEEDDEDYMREETLTYSDLAYTINNQALSNFTYTFIDSGRYSLVASYFPYIGDNKSETVTLSISVDTVVLQSITKTYSGTTSFVEEQSIASELEENLIVTAIYNNGNVVLDFDNLAFYEKPENDYIAFSINKRLTLSDNNKKIYVGFRDKYVELMTITIAAKDLDGITVVTQPTKTTFTIGDVISLKGIVVRANFDNGSSDLLGLEDVTISGVDTTNPITQIIEPLGRIATISYTYGSTTKTAQVNLMLAYPKLASLRINTAYVVTVYKDGDSFDASGLKVYGVFENGYEELLQSTDYSFSVTNFVSNSVIAIPTNVETNKKEYGLRIIPVTATNPYDNTDSITNSNDFKLTLVGTSAIEQTWLVFDAEVDYQNYNVGDIYDAKGVEFWVRDGESNEYKVNYSTNPAVGTILRNSQKLPVIVFFENTQSQTYTVNVNINYSDNNVNTIDYSIAIGDINGNLFTSISHGDVEIALGVKNNGETVYPLFKSDYVSKDTNVAHTNTYGFNILNYQMSEAASRCIGYMDFGLQDEFGNVIKNAHVVLFDDYINPIGGDGNVTVKYPHYVEGEAEKINKCKFGIIYNKHLFLSGNEKYKNCDWHTESINIGQLESTNYSESDYTYFSDLDYCYYGTDDTAIVGYDIYRDGDLVVIKESSRTQATLYRREAKLVTALDSQGNTIEGYYEDAYPSFDINFNGGDGGLSNRSIINFMGDTLFLTKNGLKVLSSKDTTYNKEKVVYDVSTYINPRIINENLTDAHLYTFKEKLLLKTNRGLYIGEYNLRNENNEYEWYFLDNIDADLFFEYDDELYFMNDSGLLYKFSYNESLFKDNARKFIGAGGALLSIDAANDYVIVSQEYNDYIKENNEFHLITNQDDTDSFIYANLGVFIEERERTRLINSESSFNPLAYEGLINDTENTIEIKKYNSSNEYDEIETVKASNLFYQNRIVYIDNISGVAIDKSPIVNTPYKLVKVNDDLFDYKYYLVNAITNETAVLSQTKSFRLSFVINDEAITRITNIQSSGTGKAFQLIGDHNQILDLIAYNNYSGTYKGVITNQNNVNAFYITKPYDMNTILYEKTIWQWAIVNDTELASYMDIGYLTSRKQGDYSLVIKSASGARAYSYDDTKFSFDKIQFTSDKLPHIYNRYRVLPGVGFIRFLFKNFEDSNIVLDQLSLIYSISQSIKGVK